MTRERPGRQENETRIQNNLQKSNGAHVCVCAVRRALAALVGTLLAPTSEIIEGK